MVAVTSGIALASKDKQSSKVIFLVGAFYLCALCAGMCIQRYSLIEIQRDHGRPTPSVFGAEGW